MGTTAVVGTELVLKRLKEFGVVLETDPMLPSVAGLVAGGQIKGSWWAHPRAQEIFAVLQQVAEHKDVLITKLISGKVTFVHRKLWSEIVSIGSAREEWQSKGLSTAARALLKMIDHDGELRSDRLEWPARFKLVKPGQAARELEKRLLIHSEEVHTEKGAHAKQLETWQHWTQRIRFNHNGMDVGNAKRKLEQRVFTLNERFGTSVVLPWIRIK